MIEKNNKISFTRVIGIFTLCLAVSFCGKSCFADDDNKDDGYKYDSSGRTQKDDDDVPKIASSNAFSTAMSVIQSIPGFNLILPPLAYMITAGILTGQESADNIAATENDSNEGAAKVMEIIGAVVKVALSILTPSTKPDASSVALQLVYKTNQYCKHQKIYIEEKKYLSKGSTISEGGIEYPMFPIYPIDIPVDESTGQCDVTTGIFGDTRGGKLIPAPGSIQGGLDLLGAIAGMVGGPIGTAVSTATMQGRNGSLSYEGTKCSVSYSPTETECMAMDVTIMSTHYAEVATVAAACILSDGGAGIAEAIKILGEIAGAVVGTFFDNKLALDPLTLYAVFNVQNFLPFIVNLLAELLNIPISLPCLITRLVAAQIVDMAAKLTMKAVYGKQYKKASTALAKYTFCGYNWLSYEKTHDGKYWQRGHYAHSYYRKVIDDIEGVYKDGKLVPNCTGDRAIRNPPDYVTPCDKDMRNQEYREYLYGGIEYDGTGAPKVASSSSSNELESRLAEMADRHDGSFVTGIPDSGYSQNDNRASTTAYSKKYCYDPRTTEQKGYSGLSQRYYMRGNEKANFACNRFFYDGANPCILPESDVVKEDDGITFVQSGYYQCQDNNKKCIDKYSKQCQQAFVEARRCCMSRRQSMICLTERTDIEGVHNVAHKFCMANVLTNGYNSTEISSLFLFLQSRDKDLDKVTCEMSGAKFEASKKKGTDRVCVFSHGFCPYDFKLNAGLNYRASYCDSSYFNNYPDDSSILERKITHNNKSTCEEGLFSVSFRDKYKGDSSNGGKKFAAYTFYRVKDDMNGFNNGDFEKIYNFGGVTVKDGKEEKKIGEFNTENFSYDSTKINNLRYRGFSTVRDANKHDILQRHDLSLLDIQRLKSSAFGQTKNFCQYRAHCVEVDEEAEYEDLFNVASLFLDSSCSGKTTNSRNRLQDDSAGVPRQLSAPVVECIFESLKNLIAGIAGNSLCETGETLNNNGLCGIDDEETVVEQLRLKNTAYFEGRYKKMENKYVIKGQPLPESSNPFLKMQKYFIGVIRAALTLFLMLFFYKKLMMGDLESFTKAENMPKLTYSLFKFAVVIWLIFYNGWQQGVYNYLVNFSTASYSFVNNIFVKNIRNAKNQMLNLNGTERTLRVREKDLVDAGNNRTIMLCYKYDLFDNIYYSRRNSVTNKCEKGFHSDYVIESESEDAVKILVNKRLYNRQITSNITIANNQEMSQLIYYIGEYGKKLGHNQLKLEIKVGDKWDENLSSGKLWSDKYDGCYFDGSEYKPSKSYLAMFDTLDCKLIRYFGYSTNKMGPNIILYSLIMLMPSVLLPDGLVSNIISGIGSFLFGLMMSFLFIVLNVVIKAIYMFTASFFTLSILIFLSPIILPLMFFEKTKQYFDNWFEQVMGVVLKPILSFAFTVMYINIMDIILLDDVTFSGHSSLGRGPTMHCLEHSTKFLCLLNGTPVFGQIGALINAGLIQTLIDIVIVFLFFKFSDTIMDTLEEIVENLFEGVVKTTKQMDGAAAAGMKDDKGKNTMVRGGLENADKAGKAINYVRENYVNRAPGAVADRIANATDGMGKALKGAGAGLKNVGFNRLGAVANATGTVLSLPGKAVDKYDRLSKNLHKLKENIWKAAPGKIKEGVSAAAGAVKSGTSQAFNKSAIGKKINQKRATQLLEENQRLLENGDSILGGKSNGILARRGRVAALKAKEKEINDKIERGGLTMSQESHELALLDDTRKETEKERAELTELEDRYNANNQTIAGFNLPEERLNKAIANSGVYSKVAGDAKSSCAKEQKKQNRKKAKKLLNKNAKLKMRSVGLEHKNKKHKHEINSLRLDNRELKDKDDKKSKKQLEENEAEIKKRNDEISQNEEKIKEIEEEYKEEYENNMKAIEDLGLSDDDVEEINKEIDKEEETKTNEIEENIKEYDEDVGRFVNFVLRKKTKLEGMRQERDVLKEAKARIKKNS
ncbi:hypothetical protein FACS1894152_0270 [Bacilli bacterium]|nr:hypothetical protein FACS1894152_0270 [Bacilli bacterium]